MYYRNDPSEYSLVSTVVGDTMDVKVSVNRLTRLSRRIAKL